MLPIFPDTVCSLLLPLDGQAYVLARETTASDSEVENIRDFTATTWASFGRCRVGVIAVNLYH